MRQKKELVVSKETIGGSLGVLVAHNEDPRRYWIHPCSLNTLIDYYTSSSYLSAVRDLGIARMKTKEEQRAIVSIRHGRVVKRKGGRGSNK